MNGDWVDDFLLAGQGSQVCLHLGRPVTRDELRAAVEQRSRALRGHGIGAGGSVVLRLPPSLAYVANLLAGWRLGAQVALLDHRLSEAEARRACERLQPQLVVAPPAPVTGALRAFHEVAEVLQPYPGGPAATGHALIQLSSGSTGPSKVIGRSVASLTAEVDRYTRIKGVPQPGERIVLLASMVHVLGLVGGLLYALHAGTELALPERTTVGGILAAVAAGTAPTTLIGVPFHIELLASVEQPPALPLLTGMTTGGELVRDGVWRAFTDRYRVRLGNMYGMTEAGVIATDLFSEHRPAVAPAPGMRLREAGGELLLGAAESPYVGPVEPGRWADGWLRTRDAGAVDPQTGLVTVLGRLDSQISVGGLKVDLTEVEHTLAGLPGVTAAVVLAHNGAIEAYAVLEDPASAPAVESSLAGQIAAYKRPRTIHVVAQLPRTATGKVVRDRAALRATL
jgi:3-hydroxy-4-methylanthranilate adenylyltransferase